MKKRNLTWITFIMCFCLSAIFSVKAHAYETLPVDQVTSVTLNSSSESKVLAFTPTVSADYKLWSIGSLDTVCYVYGSEQDMYDGEYLYCNDDANFENRNFAINGYLEAGHTYYIRLYLYSGSGSFDVKAVQFIPNFKLSKTSLTMNMTKDSWGYTYVSGGSYKFDITDYVGLSDPVVTSSTGKIDTFVYVNGDHYTVEVQPNAVCTGTITVKSGNISKTVSVKVLKAAFQKNSKNIKQYSKTWDPNESAIILYKGEKTTLKTTGTSGTIKWSSSNKKVATVTSNGVVKAKGNGTATIKATFSGITIGYKVEVSYKTAVKAVRQAIKVFPAKYSQAKRMKKGYYDCSSYVWRNYKAAGKSLQSKSYAPTAASLAKWCANNKRMVYAGNVDLYKVKLLPGDLIFEGGAKNGRYKGIYHVDLYQGNRTTLSVDRIKGGWYGKIYVARPCGGKVKVKNY